MKDSHSQKHNSIVKNTSMLYIMNIAKIFLPLVTLPYLTRALSKDCYGTVAYIKATMQYFQILVDFGFLLSATKDIVNAKNDKSKIAKIIGDTLIAKFMLVLFSFVILIALMFFIPILRANILYTVLSFIVVALTCLLMDFLFRGLEEMHVITIRFVIMKLISTILTFLFIKCDNDIIWIPILDIIGSIIAIILVFWEMKKRNICISFTGIKTSFEKLKESAVFFLSNMATTAFSALNTVLIGIFIETNQVAEWSVCLQMVQAVQYLYSPVTDGIYPHMIKTKDWNILKKTTIIYMPIIFAGCLITFFAAEYGLIIVGGDKYVNAVPLLRSFIPLLIFSFPSMIFGWPALGAIGKVKETTKTTLITAGLQVVGLLILLLTNCFTVINIALLRGLTEGCMFLMRYSCCRKYRHEFIN